jgi:hypothetical protein
MSRICNYDDCKTRSSYGDPETKISEFCKKHAPLEYINVVSKRCAITGCNKQANYGKKDSTNAEFCPSHAPKGYINVRRPLCQHVDCYTTASFGDAVSKTLQYCAMHATKTCVNLVSKFCKYPECKTIAAYGKPGSKKLEFCSKHSPEEYVIIFGKTCEDSNCNKLPTFGMVGTKIPRFCKSHAPEGFVNVKDKKCKYDGCNTQPHYGMKDSKTAEYCSKHAPEGYVDIKHKRCNYKDCQTRANYGKKGSKIAEFCKKHAPSSYVDICNKICKYDRCKIRANYGLPGYSAEYCDSHKKPNMISNPSKVKDVDFKECAYCCTKIHYSQQYCIGCNNYIKDGKTVKRKHKELEIKALLDTNEIKYTHDLIVKDGCSKKRPDFVIATGWGTIILEVDENQHNRKTYTCECELTRMKQIYFDCGVQNLLFIRYNPDKYEPISGVEKTSQQRHQFLTKYLNYHTVEKINGLGVIYLFYDGFVETAVEIEYIDPYEMKEYTYFRILKYDKYVTYECRGCRKENYLDVEEIQELIKYDEACCIWCN